MPKRLFDTSLLIAHFNQFPEQEQKTPAALRDWGAKLVEIHSTDPVCSPVVIELLAGTRDQQELYLHLAFLSAFTSIDDGKIPPGDWQKAQQLAQRVPSKRSGRARDLGDCLIRAIADRLHCDVLALDKWFSRTR